MRWFVGVAFLVGCGDPDEDGDGFSLKDDCDDTDPAVHPGQPEICDGIDQDCDGLLDDEAGTEWFADTDKDGFGAGDGTLRCAPEKNEVAVGGDCDDADPEALPGGEEVCDGVDQDCDGTPDDGLEKNFYVDLDNDGFGTDLVRACDRPSDASELDGDCNDDDEAINPFAREICDGIDQDCDDDVDEGVQVDAYPDLDGDGFGELDSAPFKVCVPGPYEAVEATDCDDTRADVFPGAVEVCDGADQNCDSAVDEGVTVTSWPDVDLDGWGDVALENVGCSVVSGWITVGGDCDDAAIGVHPGAAEVCDGVDQDCDLHVDEDLLFSWYDDLDADTYGDPSTLTEGCALPANAVTRAGDCNDGNAAIHPFAIEVCDGLDQDCDALVDENLNFRYWYDGDADSWGDANVTQTGCTLPTGWVLRAGDCNDANTTVHTGAGELCDGLDQDCDTFVDEGLPQQLFYTDADLDQYGVLPQVQACGALPGKAVLSGDCNDAVATVHPGAAEVCDGVDQDCDFVVDDGVTVQAWPDADDDGIGAIGAPATVCTVGAAQSAVTGDCDDGAEDVYPGATEVCDGVDQDCTGVADEGLAVPLWTDKDGDGDGATDGGVTRGCADEAGLATVAGDCDDGDAAIGQGCAPVLAGDWATFGGDDGRTGHASGTVSGGVLVEAWSWSSAGDVLREPVVANGRALVTVDRPTGDDAVVSIELLTGAVDWEAPIVGSAEASAPTVEDGAVFLQRISPGDGQVLALDEVSGGGLWEAPFGAQSYAFYAPLVLDGRVLVGGGVVGGMYAFDAVTGAQQWFQPAPLYWGWTPAAADGVVYTLVGGELSARSPVGGMLQWQRTYPFAAPASAMGTVPAVAEGVAVFVLAGDLHAVDVASHLFDRWTVVGGFSGSATVADGLAYAIRDGELAQIDLADGFAYRTFPGDGALAGKPVVTDDVVVVSSADATYLYQLWDGTELAVTDGGDLAAGDGVLLTVAGDTVTAWAWQ